MVKDNYYIKLEREYMHTTGQGPTTKELSDFFYDRKLIGNNYAKFLRDIGLKKANSVIEVGKGNVDSLIHSDSMHNIRFMEISPYIGTFAKDLKIDKVYGNLDVNNDGIVIIKSPIFPRTDVGTLSSIMIEGDLDYSKMPLYTGLYGESKDFYLGIFGHTYDKDYDSKIRILNNMKKLLEQRSGKKLEIYSNDSNNVYQKVIYYKNKIVDK